jgi:hypothetical protein
MRFDDFMYGGDMYGGDMFDAYGGAGLPSFAVEPPAPAPPSLSVTPPGAYASGAVEAPFGTYDRTLSAVGLGPQADPRSMYTPEQLAYFDQQAAYTAAQNALGYDVSPLRQFVTSAPLYDRREDVQGGTVAPSDNFQQLRGQQRYLTPEEVDAQMAAANAFSPNIADRFGTNIIPEPAGEGGYSASTRVSYADQPFRLYNKGQLVFEGVGRDDALKATQMAQGFTDVGGKKADWKLETKLGPTADYTTVAEDAADVSGVMGAFVNYGIPLLLAAAVGPAAFGQLAAGMGAATGAGAATAGALTAGTLGAVGGGLSQALQGASIGDIAKSALISGGTAGLMQGSGASDLLRTTMGGQSFGEAAKSAIADAAAQAAPSALGSAVQAAPLALANAASQAVPNEILVSAARALPSVLSQAVPSAAVSGLSGLGQSLLPSQPATTQTPLAAQEPPPSFAALPGDSPLITVPGSVPSSNAFPSLAAGLSGVAAPVLSEAAKLIAAEQQAAEQQRADEDRMITVTGATKPPPSLVVPSLAVPALAAVPSFAAATAQPAPVTTKEVLEEDPLTVTGVRDATTVVPTNLVPSAITAATAPLLSNALTTPEPATTTPDKKLSVSDYLRLAGLASSAIGLLGGGGGPEGTAAGIVPGGLGRLNPIFSAKLPTGADVNIPGGVGTASNLAARPMGDEDWLTYGQRPEKSFFNYVPQPPIGKAHGGSLAAKRGGRPSRSSFAVNGPGTGRSDDIPAVLSDGEYVIDAETVALLGDGSSKAGAKKLDDLRVKIRKHKGQKLSQGRFSSDAKKPEAYLTGGRI